MRYPTLLLSPFLLYHFLFVPCICLPLSVAVLIYVCEAVVGHLHSDLCDCCSLVVANLIELTHNKKAIAKQAESLTICTQTRWGSGRPVGK